MDNRTEPLAAGVWRVEVGWNVNAYVLADDGRGDGGGLTLVDAGGRSGGPRLVRSLRMLGFDPRAARRLLLTHWHADHAGSAASFARSSAGTQVHAGANDLTVVTGVGGATPAATTRLGRVVHRLARRPDPTEARALADGQRLEIGGGLQVVASPGHTSGHCAFWLPNHGVLLAGDAVWNVVWCSRGPRTLCSDLPLVPGSLRRLAALQPEVVAPGHGPPIRRQAAERLAALAGTD